MRSDSGNIREFIRHTLGCMCPEEVLRDIRYQAPAAVEEVSLVGRIDVGGRLLVYVAEFGDRTFVGTRLEQMIKYGQRERDSAGFNRLRIVLLSADADNDGRYAGELFESLNSDEKIHLHVLQREKRRSDHIEEIQLMVWKNSFLEQSPALLLLTGLFEFPLPEGEGQSERLCRVDLEMQEGNH